MQEKQKAKTQNVQRRSPYAPRRRKPLHRQSGNETYKDFDATELYCTRCATAVPVRKRLLLVLPEGEKYEYLCAFCSSSLGTKVVKDSTLSPRIII